MFNIPAQDVRSALNAFAAQSGTRLLFPYDELSGFRSRGVSGRMAADKALARIIAGTPLRVAMAQDGIVALSMAGRGAGARRAAPIQLAQAAAPNPANMMALLAMAEVAAPAAEEAAAGDIIVTGTRQTNRTVADSLAPIDVLSASELTSTSGKQSVRDLLGTLVPSINVSNSGAGASFAVKTLSLRGLSSDQLLVLVNGKRRHNTATLFINGTTQNGQSPADLDLIPTSAIERIEVLRDGASAQYGSDALAGVINLILKDDDKGGTAAVLFGQTFGGDGDTGQALGDFGLPLGDGGHLHFAADARLQARTDRGGPNTSVLYPRINGQLDPREATANRYVNHPGQPQVAVLNLSYDAALPLGEAVRFYSFGTASTRHSDAWLTFRNPNASNNIIEIFPDGYVPRLHVYDRDYQVAAGLRGDVGLNFVWDLSSTYSRNRVRYRETTALNVSMGPASPTDFYIGRVIASEWTSNIDLKNEFDLGFLEEPLLAAIGAEYRKNWYEIGAGEPASYIDGGYRAPPGKLFPGVARQPGSQGVTGFPADAAGKFSRHSIGAYANFEQTIVKGWDAAAAVRYEDYSDAGTTTTGKFSTRLEPIEGIALRGTVSTGFRAPTLQQQHYASSSTIGVLIPPSTVTQLYPVRALPVDSPAAVALGATPLKPEKSTNYSAGFVFTAIPALNVTIDAYQIDIDDRILLSGTLIDNARSNGAVRNAFLSAGLDPNQGGFYFSNAADTRTRGLDIVGTYRAGLGSFGRATFSLSGNFNKTKFRSIDLPPPALANAGLVLIDRARQGDFTKGTPRDKFIGSVNWELGPATLNLRATRYGKVTMVSNIAANDDTIDPKVIFDVDLAAKLNDNVRVSIGANNLFNVYPTVLKPANQGVTGFSYYNAYSPYGISGGFYYTRLAFTF
ncbi:TonB-dependent receptor [Sphingomonas oleivorans]|nr:TonB-dependent receptor [Sphingomonas oleivorans]